ncbi:MAG TPA: carbohydrate porin [Humisphaera sp.]|nr:carbohydrate porin [Humisphaera sp.]
MSIPSPNSPFRNGSVLGLTILVLNCLAVADSAPVVAPPSSQPATKTALAIPVEEEAFDPEQHLLVDPWGWRKKLANNGITLDPYLIVDNSQNFIGGVNTRSNNFRDRFNVPITIDTEKLFGLHGGTFVVVYQLQHGENASHQLTGDAQNFSFLTDADGRSQIGQLWYQQKFFHDLFRLRLGKLEGNADFDALDNDQDFMNNSFQTSPTLGLLPSFPDTGTGVQLFFEPDGGFYAGAGVFDGSGARGVHTGETGPRTFFDRPSDLFYITEIGLRYKLEVAGRNRAGRVGVGYWYDANPFPRIDNNGSTVGTYGAYILFDQLLWKPRHELPIPSGPPGANNEKPEEENYPQGAALSASVSWADPLVNRIDGNALAGITWTGPMLFRPIDELGFGATYAHFSRADNTRYNYELAVEAFYRIRFTQWISLKPDLQYIAHPSGSGMFDEPDRHNALVASLRMEVSF